MDLQHGRLRNCWECGVNALALGIPERAALLDIIGKISKRVTWAQIVDALYDVFSSATTREASIWSADMREITPRRE